MLRQCIAFTDCLFSYVMFTSVVPVICWALQSRLRWCSPFKSSSLRFQLRQWGHGHPGICSLAFVVPEHVSLKEKLIKPFSHDYIILQPYSELSRSSFQEQLLKCLLILNTPDYIILKTLAHKIVVLVKDPLLSPSESSSELRTFYSLAFFFWWGG